MTTSDAILKEWVKSRYKQGDKYYRVCDKDDCNHKITAIVDDQNLDDIADPFRAYIPQAIKVDLDNHLWYKEYAVAYALRDAAEAIKDDVWEKHREEGVNRHDRGLVGNIASVISQYTMDDYCVDDEMQHITEEEYNIPADEVWDWLEKNKHLEDKIREQAYDTSFEFYKDSWLPMIDVEDFVIMGQGNKGDLVWDGDIPTVFIPNDNNIATMYGPEGKATGVMLPLPCPLTYACVGMMVDGIGDFWY